MSRCQVCESSSTFLYTCEECGKQYCAEHIDQAAHDCSTLEADETPTTELRQVILGVGFFAAILISVAAFVWLLGPTGPLAGVDVDTAATTTATPPADKDVIEVVNDARTAANQTPVGYYGPLAELAANRSWTAGPADTDSALHLDGDVTCRDYDTLEYEGPVLTGRDATTGEAAVDEWMGRESASETLLDADWDLAGAAVTRSDGEGWIRLVMCESSAS